MNKYARTVLITLIVYNIIEIVLQLIIGFTLINVILEVLVSIFNFSIFLYMYKTGGKK